MKLSAPKFWRTINPLSLLLWPISLIYQFITAIYNLKNRHVYIPSAKVITVGNLNLGGAGKTPVTIALTKLVKGKFAILTRGFLGNIKGPVMVRDEHTVFDIGDEAILLSRNAPTCVAKNRLEGIKFLESLGFETIITDDGLQDNSFAKSLSILVVDSYACFGNEMVFPAGPLRENIKSGLKKADLAILIGEGKCEINFPVIKAKLVALEDLGEKKFLAFAGIGNPDKFFHSVKLANGQVINSVAFADHHQYTENELELLMKLAKQDGLELITTEKDHVRISSENQIKTLPVELVWDNQNEILNKIQGK